MHASIHLTVIIISHSLQRIPHSRQSDFNETCYSIKDQHDIQFNVNNCKLNIAKCRHILLATTKLSTNQQIQIT